MFSSRQLFFVSFSPEKTATASVEDEESGEYVEEDEQYDEGYEEGDEAGEPGQLAPNQAIVTFSYSLMSQLRQTARSEGVTVDDIIRSGRACCRRCDRSCI